MPFPDYGDGIFLHHNGIIYGIYLLLKNKFHIRYMTTLAGYRLKIM